MGLNFLREVRQYLPEEDMFRLCLEDNRRAAEGRGEAPHVQRPRVQREHSAAQ